MPSIEWTDAALRDAVSILAYHAEKGNMDVGQQIVRELFKATDRLKEFPQSGRVGRTRQTRELVVGRLPYILVYKVPSGNVVRILRVDHVAQLYPHTR